MVLFVSVVVPVYATPAVVNPADYASSINKSDRGTTLYTFRFRASPYYTCYEETTAILNASGVLSWNPAPNCSYYRIAVLPLGGTTYDSVMIDVRDFKTGAVLDVTYNAMLHLSISSEGSSNLTFNTSSRTVLYWFDENYNHIKTDNSTVVQKEGSWGSNNDIWLMQNTFDMTIPENAVYVSVYYISQIYDPDSGDITKIASTDAPWIDVVVEKDDVNADSLLLESIEKELGELNDTATDIKDELGDLNDKTDVIINGTPEQNSDANNKHNSVQGTSQDVDDILDNLNSMSSFDVSTNYDIITNFLSSPGWKDVSNLLSPLTDWEHASTIMLIVIAFATISVILFGR